MMRVQALSLLALTGCDVVWGLSGEPAACELRSFEAAEELDMVTSGDQFTVDGSGDRAVVTLGGELYEQSLANGELTKLNVTLYSPLAIAVAPEGNLLFHSGALEPPLLQVATRGDDGVWVAADRAGPKGVIAGVPSAEDFGPRRVLVRTKINADLQEYEDDGVTWQPVGPRLPGFGSTAPNLTENGLTMVFVDVETASGGYAVFAASRASLSDQFGDPRLLRIVGQNASAQLSGKKTCDTLFTSEPDALRRYEQ